MAGPPAAGSLGRGILVVVSARRRTDRCRPKETNRLWLLSPELVAAAYGADKAELRDPVTRKVGPAAYDVGERNSEWVVTVYLAQPLRQGAGGNWVVTRTASPEGSYSTDRS